MFVIKRTDQGGGYVAQPGRKYSYTTRLELARTYPTRELAIADSCPENEVIRDVRDLLQPVT